MAQIEDTHKMLVLDILEDIRVTLWTATYQVEGDMDIEDIQPTLNDALESLEWLIGGFKMNVL